jgi:hypothetical protein
MKLSPNDRKKLLTIILDSYPDIAELEMLIKLELGENLDNITSGSNNKQKVFKLIEWAETTGKLPNLLNAISKDRPDNLELQEIIKNLQDKYNQNPKNQDDLKIHKQNKLSLFIRYLSSILIILIGIVSYKIYDDYHQPRLSCNDTELQKEDDSIKIIISNFDGSIASRLETNLYQKFDSQLTSKASKVIVCSTTNTKHKIKNNSDARELGKQLLPENEKQRDLALIIWLNESKFIGGIEFINDNMQDIPLSFDLDAEKSSQKIVDNEFYKKMYLFTSYGLSQLFYYQLNNSLRSQDFLQSALNNTINCDIKKINNIANNKEIANLYFKLGLSYEDKEFQNFPQALRAYECGLLFDREANKISFQIATVYERRGNRLKAKIIYKELTKSNKVHNDIQSSAYAQIGILLAQENKCLEAERELNNSVNYSLYIGLELRAYTRFFNCKNFRGAIEDLEKLCQGIDKNECTDILISYHDRLFKLEKSQQRYVVEILDKLSQSQPQLKSIINPIIEQKIINNN